MSNKNRFTDGLQVWRREGRVKIRHMKPYFRHLRRSKVSNMDFLCESRSDLVVNQAQNMKLALQLKTGDLAYCWYTKQNETLKELPSAIWRHERKRSHWLWNVDYVFQSGYCSYADEYASRPETAADIQQNNQLREEYFAGLNK